MIALATLMYEILLTRIFSVTMYYHFVFMAVSIAMFGLAVGGLIVYLFAEYFQPEKAKNHLAISAVSFAGTILVSFALYLNIPFTTGLSPSALLVMAMTYLVIAIPFVFSGLSIALALTKFPRQVSQLYAADLLGAAAGCILLIHTLRFTDGPTAVIVTAALASVGGLLFGQQQASLAVRRVAPATMMSLIILAIAHAWLASKGAPLLRLNWVKGAVESTPLYEKWNSFSRVTVRGDPDRWEEPVGWGLSSRYPSKRNVRQLHMYIDAGAYTVLTAFEGDFRKLDHLKYDVTNIAHYLRPNSKVAIIGAGGGRDVLSALAFGQKKIVAIEMNPNIMRALNGRFGDFAGHLDRDPRVTFVTDEARSYLARQSEKVDMIQISLVDTWAATAAGAYACTENSLYTLEAWRLFLERLNPKGILTVSRWYAKGRPSEMYRLAAMATTVLKQRGVENPRDHIMVVRRFLPRPGWEQPDGVGTILVSNDAFSNQDVDGIERLASRMDFDVIFSPRDAQDFGFTAIVSAKDLDRLLAAFPVGIAPPTDNSPFFFYTFRLRDVAPQLLWRLRSNQAPYPGVVFTLCALLLVVLALTFLSMIVPLVLTTQKGALGGSLPLFLFFAAIGLGFMLVEISQMQRFMIFLGHPTYALSVVLFALLLSSGLGSYSTGSLASSDLGQRAASRFLLLLGALISFGLLTPAVINLFRGSTTPLRIGVAVAILLPLGFFMGMAFPLGMKLAAARSGSLMPWLWGINGATSVCASVLAFVIALTAGISAAFWTGFWCYGIAFLAFVWQLVRSRAHEEGAEHLPGARRHEQEALDSVGALGS